MRFLATFIGSSCLLTSVIAGPMVHHIEYVTPRAGQRGTTVEVTIEGTSFFINLGEVALLCRDTCSTMTITPPRKGKIESSMTTSHPPPL
jgi:hypothetical protein